jgi:hypothetical protein
VDVSQLAFLLFAFFSSVRVLSYIPQILCVARDSNGATAISYATWGLWTGANVSTAFYAVTNLGDRWLATVSSVYAACCVCVIALTFAKRRGAHRPGPRMVLRAVSRVSARRADLVVQLRQAAASRTAKVLGDGAVGEASDLHIARICHRMVACDVALLVLRLALAADPRLRRRLVRPRQPIGIEDDSRRVSLAAARGPAPSLEPTRCG